MSAKIKVAMLPERGTALQRNIYVQKIYTASEPIGDGRWEVVTVVETNLVLDPLEPGHDAERCESLILAVEADSRAGVLVGRVILKGA